MAEWVKYKNGCYQTSCSTLNEFIKAINEVYKSDNKILFRGHSNQEKYELISKLDRNYKLFYATIKSLKMEEELPTVTRDVFIEDQLAEFRKRIRGKVESDVFFNDDILAWALGQHYGLDTPYLDWTETPFIATFFSVIDNFDIDGCVYALDMYRIEDMNEEAESNEELKKTINDRSIKNYNIQFIQPITNFNTRLNAQNGSFTLTPKGISIDDWISTFEDFKNKKVLKKIIIKAELKEDLLDFLEKANINYSTIYPDLQGISMYCNHRLKIYENNIKSNLMIKNLFKQVKELDKRVKEFREGK